MKIIVTKVRDLITPDLRSRLRRVADPRPALMAMGTVVVSQAMRAFTQASLRPTPWPPLSAATLKQRKALGRGSKPLMRSGTLSRSPRVISATSRRVTVGTDRPYAKYHQLGTERIPARPFFPFFADGRPTEAIKRLILAAADRALRLRR